MGRDQVPGRVTAREVAEAAGTSIATVSLVVNNKADGRVAAETRDRVWAAVERLNYVVDPIASSLARGAGRMVGFVAPDSASPFFASVTTGVAAGFDDLYDVVLVMSPPTNVVKESVLRRVRALRLAGLLVYAPSPRLRRELKGFGPVVMMDAPDAADDTPTVNLDLVGAANAIVEHLLGLGHTKFAYVDARTNSATFAVRRAAAQQRLKEAGFPMDKRFVVSSLHMDVDSTANEFAAAWGRWRRARVTAVICATDSAAYGVLRAVQDLGLRVPEELAVASFDDLPYSALTAPPLTTVRLPAFDLGRVAGERLRSLIEGTAADSGPITLPTSLVVRASTTG